MTFDNILLQYYRHEFIPPQLQFTSELECNNILDCLGLSISSKDMETEFDIYPKCTYSDVFLRFNSFYPVEYKLATSRFLTNRLKTSQLRNEVIKQEILYIQNNIYYFFSNTINQQVFR
jgi:hypothetical protein